MTSNTTPTVGSAWTGNIYKKLNEYDTYTWEDLTTIINSQGNVVARQRKEELKPAVTVFKAKNGFLVSITKPSTNVEAVVAESYICQTPDDVANIITLYHGDMLHKVKGHNDADSSS